MYFKPLKLSLFGRKIKFSATAQQGSWIVVGLVILVSIYSQISLRRARFWVNHTFEVLDAVQQVETNLLNAQFHWELFLANRELSAVTNYQQKVDAAMQALSSLKSLTDDNAVQQRNLEVFSELLMQASEQQQKNLQQYQVNPQRGVQDKLLNQRLFYTEDIQAQLAKIQQEEKKLLAQRRRLADRQGAFATGLMSFGVAIAFLMFWYAHRNQEEQAVAEAKLNDRLKTIEMEQDLSSHLLTCRTADEAHDILQSFLAHLLPECTGGIYEINNSRNQMVPTVGFGKVDQVDGCSPRECWALRRGEVQIGQHEGFKIPCKLCRMLHPDGIPTDMMCLPLQAHEQTIGILHLTKVPVTQQQNVKVLAHQISLPLAVLHLQSELEYLSFHDGNTGIYNRRFLDEMLTRAIATAQRKNYRLPKGASPCSVGVIFMDVDHFKRFNSEYGHEMGDTVLRTLGAFLTEITRAGEDVPCRYGGEEFVLVMPGATEQATLAKAELIRQGIKLRPTPTGATITVSVGVAVYPKHSSTPEGVLKAANTALLRAKSEGRDRVVIAE
jgi:diguanylate cyclase (GGDEF)-like protein